MLRPPSFRSLAIGLLLGLGSLGWPAASSAVAGSGPARPSNGPGLIWRQLAPPSAIADDLTGLVAWDGGLAALGGVDQVPARIWTSPDGRRWTNVPLPDELLPTPGSGVTPLLVPAFGGLVLVDHHTVSGSVDRIVVWWSADGSAWQRSPDSALLEAPHASSTPRSVEGCVTIADAIGVQGRLVILGQGCVDAPAPTLPSQSPGAPRDGCGDCIANDPPMVPVIWSSIDGHDWRRELVPDPPELVGGMRLVASSVDPGWVVAWDLPDPDYVSRLPIAPIPGGGAVTVTGDTAWRSPGMTDWSAVMTMPGADLSGVASVADALVTVGTQVEGPAGRRLGRASSSTDGGLTWTAASDASDMPELGFGQVVISGDRAIATGVTLDDGTGIWAARRP